MKGNGGSTKIRMRGFAQRSACGWEHFAHGADIGVRGVGPTEEKAFEQAAVALTAAVTLPGRVAPREEIAFHCEAADRESLLVAWLNAVIYEMSVREMLFQRFEVRISGTRLDAAAWGEKVNIGRHEPAVEVKGATYTSLFVGRNSGGGGWSRNAWWMCEARWKRHCCGASPNLSGTSSRTATCVFPPFSTEMKR